MPSDNQIHEILQRSHSVAIVGLSDDPRRPSYAVARFLQREGYRVIPVNPNLHAPVLGVNPVASLRDIREHVDVVCVFRRGEFVSEIVEDALAIRADVLWTQLGIVSREAARRAEAGRMAVVMDRCMAIEYRRLSRYAEAALA